MQNKMIRKWFAIAMTTLMIGLIFGAVVNAIGNIQVFNLLGNNAFSFVLDDGYTDITVEEAWNLLNDTSNGIQIPIDVRTDDEWKDEHIDTPPPENPRHHNFYEWDNENILMEFMLLYHGKEIVIYCRTGGRSVSAANILIDNGFNGTIYNMLGGITAWNATGFPTIGNRPPETPIITGSTNGKAGKSYDYTISATDPDSDKVYYCINWSDDTDEICLGPYPTDLGIIVNHTWDEKGEYTVKVKARDIYNEESEWAILEVTMPRNKLYKNTPFLRFLENHLYVFPLLRHLLGV